MKSSLRIVLFLSLMVLIGTIMFTACSKKQEFVVKSISCTTDRELNDDLIWIGDVSCRSDPHTEWDLRNAASFRSLHRCPHG